MKLLRLFISNDLDNPVHWVTLENNVAQDYGYSSIDELNLVTSNQVEVYLNANCCSIFVTDVTGISTKKLTEELILGMIEENLVDDIEAVRPIILRVEDDHAYIAVFNREFYTDLLDKLSLLGTNIRFIQSFAYSTVYHENSWTLFLSDEQNFVRTSKYEYFLLDDDKPYPTLLEDMLKKEKPEAIYLQVSDKYDLKTIEEKYDVKCITVEGKAELGTLVWNFYNQKSTKFKINLEIPTKIALKQLLKTTKYLVIFAISFWVLDVIMLSIHDWSLTAKTKKQLSSIVPSSVNSSNSLANVVNIASDALLKMKHQRGIYDSADAIPLFATFLRIVSNVGTDDITQISYNDGTLEIFLSNSFNGGDFINYADIFATQGVTASITTYKLYTKENSQNQEDNNNSAIPSAISDSTEWVIILKNTAVQSIHTAKGIS